MALDAYMVSYLGNVTTHFGWSASDFAVDVADTLEAYGVSSEADATDAVKLHALAKMKCWEKVLTNCATNYDFSTDGATWNRSQLFEMADKMYNKCVMEALQYMATYAIEQGKLDDSMNDPYSNVPYWDRTD